MCYREKEKKAEELQKEEDEALQQKAKLEDMFMERRHLEERRKKVELGYGEANVIFIVIVLLQLDTVHCLMLYGHASGYSKSDICKIHLTCFFCKKYVKYSWCGNVTLCSECKLLLSGIFFYF